MMLQDEHGRVRIQVDGDLLDSGPTAILHFVFTSEPSSYLDQLNNELDFGTFRVILEGTAKVETNVALTKADTETLIAALQWQIRDEETA